MTTKPLSTCCCAVPPARGAAARQRRAEPAAHVETARHVLADRARAQLVAGGVVVQRRAAACVALGYRRATVLGG